MTLLSLNSGTLFAGRYRIVRCIAQGGMGAVYEVIHIETERRRALKVMLPDMLQSQEMRDRFRQEARVTANIESEFLVDVFDAGIDEATRMPFLVMEMLRGEELHKRLKRVGRFSSEEVITFLNQVSLALDKTHKASIVHRDLKPGNLFITERDDGSPRMKVLDFGIAKLVAEGTTNAEATRNLGTPIYMAPEQFHLGRRVSPASDIYALGMIAFTLLIGVPYWADEMQGGANVFAFAAAAVLGPQESACARARRRGVALPPAFDVWFAKVTAMEPTDRYPTASSAVQALAEVLGVSIGYRAAQPSLMEIDVSPYTSTSAPASSSTPAPRSDAVVAWHQDTRYQPPTATGRAPASGSVAPPSMPPPSSSMRPSYPGIMMAPPGPSMPSGGASPISSMSPMSQPSEHAPSPASGPSGGFGGPAALGLVTPISIVPSQNTSAPMMQTGALTTGTGVMTGVPGRAPSAPPLMLVGVIFGVTSVIATVAVLLLSKGDPPADSPSGAQAGQAVSALIAAPLSIPSPPAVEPASTSATASPTPSSPEEEAAAPKASSSAKAQTGKSTSKSGAGSTGKTKAPSVGTGTKRPTIYTPD